MAEGNRKFGGRTFRLGTVKEKKSGADQEAGKWRKGGYLARITKGRYRGKTMYYIWFASK
jgi:hypothetical protein